MPQKELLELAEAHCHKAMLGQTLTSDTSKSGGSLAQAKVHAGVQADEVMKHAEFVADVINRQLIPAIVHLNFGKVEGMPLPELRFKLPQAAANIERAQFWSQVMAIPGMSVVKSEVYDSLGIAMPSDDDEVLEAPSPQDGGLAGMLQGFGQQEPKSKDEVALAARSRSKQDLLPAAMQAWLAPIKKKLIEARKAGASFEELREQMLKWRPDTDALADAFAENVEAGLRGEDIEERINARNPWGCNKEHKPGCPKSKGTTREPKIKNAPRLFRVDPDASPHKQKTQLADAIEKATNEGVHFEAVINHPKFGELIIDCGKPGKTIAKQTREQKAENEKAKKENRPRKIISSGGNGAIHALEGRHHASAFDIAEAIIDGEWSADKTHPSRINLTTEKCKVTLEREIKKSSGVISLTKAKLHTATKI
jgi:hypothetical protein